MQTKQTQHCNYTNNRMAKNQLLLELKHCIHYIKEAVIRFYFRCGKLGMPCMKSFIMLLLHNNVDDIGHLRSLVTFCSDINLVVFS